MEKRNYSEPYKWWGLRSEQPTSFSVMQLIEVGSFNSSLMALLWEMLSHRSSIIVGSKPAEAGKTTTLDALLSFLPSSVQRIYLRGSDENFDFSTDLSVLPTNSYLLVNEISDHWPPYLWGANVHRLFTLLTQGFAFCGTIHCDTVDDVINTFHKPPLDISNELISNLGLVVNIQLFENQGIQLRRCNTIYYILPSPTAPFFRKILLASWDINSDSFLHFFYEPMILNDLANSVGIEALVFEEHCKQRESYLDALLQKNVRSVSLVQDALERFSFE